MSHTIERLTPGDVRPVSDLLAASELSTQGLGDARVGLVAMRDQDAWIACAAVEPIHPFGLLRSVAVAPERRGEGLGRTMVEAAERWAREEGIRTLYLLTETAADFFGALGYGVVERASVPEPVRRTTQYSAMCPASAVVMARQIDQPD